MRDSHIIRFEPFHLDVTNEQLWRGQDAMRLTPKAFAVLRYFVEHAGQLLTKEALLDALWPDTYVSETALAVCIREIRQVLGDGARAPRFIETVHRRGYRFIAPLTVAAPSLAEARVPIPPQSSTRSPVSLVGREAELAQLHQRFEHALQGERQVGFITGEAGIGKTTLVDAFVAQVSTTEALWIGHGQCIEQYGAGEAYLPVLEALGRLGREPEGGEIIAILRQYAPSWLVHLPALLPPADYEALQHQERGATRDRMLRELAEAVDVLTASRPLILVLEDLHWSDASTLDWLAYVARRRDRARLLVLGTYRPVEAIMRAHPLRTVTQELQRHGQCVEMVLEYLSEAGVVAYLEQRFRGHLLPDGLAHVLHQRTNGNPLFMVTVVNTMERQRVLEERGEGWMLQGEIGTVAVGVPESLRQLIEQQLDQLSPAEQEILEAASVVGAEFSAAAVAAGVEREEGAVEMQCEALARRNQFVQARGTGVWPDGTIASQYGFLHALYQEVLYDRVPVGRRTRLHRQIGMRQEAGYGAQAREIAAELAVHFVRGRDVWRAVQYLRYAGENAQQRNAHQEAIDHLTTALEMLATLPETPERTQHELALQTAIGPALMTLKGYAAPEVEHAYARARVLCQQGGETQQLFTVLHGLWNFYLTRAEHQTTRELGEQCLALAQSVRDATMLLEAHRMLGVNLFFAGELASSHNHLEEVMRLYDRQQHRSYILLYPDDPGVISLAYAARGLWYLGYPDQALERAHAALCLAQELAHPFSLVFALLYSAVLHQLRRELSTAPQRAEAIIALSVEQGFTQFVASGTMHRGWVLVQQGQGDEGIAQIHQGLTAIRATGAELSQPSSLAMLAQSYGKSGRTEEGLRVLDEAVATAHTTDERYHMAELYRLTGTLLLQQDSPDEHQAETSYHQAIDVARRQQAKSLELRAAMSLGRLWQQQGKQDEARRLLSEVYGWFTEGFDTADLQDAKALLDALAG